MTTFKTDLSFLEQHTSVVLLSDNSAARVAVAPEWQGRVMTSTTDFDQGVGFGWLNRALIAKGIAPPEQREGLERHIYAFGGEDRFWIGPEGGQFSWYFKPDSPFEFEYWKVPAFIDTTAWHVKESSANHIVLQHQTQLTNWSKSLFDIALTRSVHILNRDSIEAIVEMQLPERLNCVAYESRNTLNNSGNKRWSKDSGMPSIWILGMLNHGSETTVVIPYAQVNDANKPIVTDDYFGKIPAARLMVDEKDSVIYFKADGAFRSKIGISAERSTGLIGSWDALANCLTIVDYNKPSNEQQYVNSEWALQKQPFNGDVINSYNDGPVDGTCLGPFYEMETSSPALALKPSDSYTHIHRTMHFEGDKDSLNALAKRLLGVTLELIEAGLSNS